MHKGNGVWRELPLPEGVDGSHIVFSYNGKCAILQAGEGYEVIGDKLVFSEAPPEGASIAVGSHVGKVSSVEAVNRINDALDRVGSLLGAMMSTAAEMDNTTAEAISDMKNTANELVERLEARIETKLGEALVTLSTQIENKATSIEQAKIATERVRDVATDKAESVAKIASEIQSLKDNLPHEIQTEKDKAISQIATAASKQSDAAVTAVTSAWREAEAAASAVVSSKDTSLATLKEHEKRFTDGVQAQSDTARKELNTAREEALAALRQTMGALIADFDEKLSVARSQADSIAAQIRRLGRSGTIIKNGG